VDVDGLKNLLKFYGFHQVDTDEHDNAVYRLALPRFAELFERLGIRATFFVIGEDLQNAANQEMVRQLYTAGHEIANHTQRHCYNFNRLQRECKRNEIIQAEQAIARTIGQKPVGFRAPGYDVDQDVLDILVELGYCYDSSVMPSLLNLPSKLLQRLLSQNGNFSGYGSLALSLAPNRPYRPHPQALWRSTASGSLWEIPVSCVPYLRVPFYANFNLFTGNTLFQLSSVLAMGMSCNYVFHAVEMLDPAEIDSRLHRHPNACLSVEQKMTRCRRFLERLQHGRRVLLSKELAAELHSARATPPVQRTV
jgi:hypothetical protein